MTRWCLCDSILRCTLCFAPLSCWRPFSLRIQKVFDLRVGWPCTTRPGRPSVMLDDTSTMDYLAVTFASRHNRPGFLVICAHRCHGLESISLLGPICDMRGTYKRVGVVGEIQVYSVHCLFDTQDANGTSGMALFHTRMS